MIARNTFIKHLELADTDQTESSLVYFTTILRPNQQYFNSTLKILDLSRPIPQCKYAKFDSSHIATIIGIMLRVITYFNVSNISLFNISLTDNFVQQYNTILEELYLQKFNFSCHDIEEMLENAVYNNTLKVLDLSCNNIGDYAAEFFQKWLEKRPNLQSLLLAHNIITDRGIR
jgi:hypothetical protein